MRSHRLVWGAYAPDLPGLGVAGKTLDEVKELIREAVKFHFEGMQQPQPCATTQCINRLKQLPIMV